MQVRGLAKRCHAVNALDEVSLELTAGRVHLLAGPDGAGTTTLLPALAGLVRPSPGLGAHPRPPFSALQRPAQVVGASLDPIRLPSFRPGPTAPASWWWRVTRLYDR